MKRFLPFTLLLMVVLPSLCFAVDLSIDTKPTGNFLFRGIESAKWEDKNLIVTIVWKGSCDNDHQWDVQVSDDAVLSLVLAPQPGTSACVSQYRSALTIKKLKRTDYSIVYKVGTASVDSLFLKKDNSFSDSCDSAPGYDCYARLQPPPEPLPPTKIFYDKKEYEDIVGKHPEFMDLFKELEVHPWEGNYFISFSPEHGIWITSTNATTPPDPSKGHKLLMSGGGVCKDFECAVLTYIDNHKSNTAVEAQLSNTLGRVVTYADPDLDAFNVLYNNEHIHYSRNGIIFKDRPQWWSITQFMFKPRLPHSSELTQPQFEEIIKSADSAYQILMNLKAVEVIGPTIDIKANKLEGFGLIPNGKEEIYTFHNRPIPRNNLISQKFQIDFADKQFYRLESTKGEFEKLKFTGNGIKDCNDGRFLKGLFTNGQFSGKDHC